MDSAFKFRDQLSLIYLLVAVGYLVLAFSFYFFGVKPLNDRLTAQHRAEIQYAVDAAYGQIDEVFKRHIALARQTASRSAIRDQQSRYVAGAISLAELQQFSIPKLDDAVQANREILGIRRHSPDAEVLFEVGQVPAEFSLAMCDLPRPGHTDFKGVLPTQTQTVMIYCSSIDSAQGIWLGFDLLFIDAESLQSTLNRPKYHALSAITFAISDQDQQIVFWPEGIDIEQNRALLQDHLSGQAPLPPGFVLHSQSLETGDLVLHTLVNEELFFAENRASMIVLTGVLLFWGVLLMAATLLAIRRLLNNAIELKALNRQVQLDGMTGLLNHTYAEQHLRHEIKRHKRYGGGYSVLMLDIDDFKKVNDTYGHPVGDVVLRETSRVLGQDARDSDLVARYGGEEFLIVMPETGAEGAWATAERLRTAISAVEHQATTETFSVTVSIGVVTCPADAISPSPTQVLKAVDEALYDSKRAGRNTATHRILGQPGPVSRVSG